ncbi:2884_t:CDS:2 [Ambispora leptoticha]|uniref:2884_t:CDS:1 n=1 Tax=Ambispora leptoticha TaxID=144679 RepID=A0A9N8YSZ7_9GLOM|nr:2884_t:CDS:2 [Ambispora leptoticha]
MDFDLKDEVSDGVDDDDRIAEVVKFAEETLSPPPLSSAQSHVIGTKPALESPI